MYSRHHSTQADQVKKYADFLFQSLDALEGIEGDWKIEVRPLFPNGKVDTDNRKWFTSRDQFIEHVLQIADQSRHVYASVNPRNGNKGTKESSPYVFQIVADLDFKSGYAQEDRDSQLEDFPLEPTLLVNSGGGYQAYWTLKTKLHRDKATVLMQRMSQHFDTDRVKDSARILRVPGTWNVKPDYPEPQKARIVSINPRNRYSSDEVASCLPALKSEYTENGYQVSEDRKVSEERNNYLASLAGKLKNAELADEAIRVALEAQNSLVCNPPLPVWEIDSLMTQVPKWDVYQGDARNGHHEEQQIIKGFETAEGIRIADGWGYINYKQKRAEGGFEPWEHLEPEVLVKGQSHFIQGDTQVAKTWAALGFSKNALSRGEVVIYLDFENGHKALYERLEILGATDDELTNFYPFVFPSLAPQDWESEWRYIVDALKPRLVVDDVLLGSLDALGLDESSNTDIQALKKILINPVKEIDSVFLALDHPGHKDKGRGRGAAYKGQAIDIEYKASGPRVNPIHPVDIKLTLSKDRNSTLNIAYKESHVYRIGGNPFQWERTSVVYPKNLNANEKQVYDHIRRKSEKKEGDRKVWMINDLNIGEKTIERICKKLSEDPYTIIYKDDNNLWWAHSSTDDIDDSFNPEVDPDVDMEDHLDW